ncbi:hypothetical protein GCM10020000_84710 [Streptomyces olivoverticillatus]
MVVLSQWGVGEDGEVFAGVVEGFGVPAGDDADGGGPGGAQGVELAVEEGAAADLDEGFGAVAGQRSHAGAAA